MRSERDLWKDDEVLRETVTVFKDVEIPTDAPLAARRPFSFWLKRPFDFLFALVALIAISPVLMGCAIAIRAGSRGPIFFKQKRYGRNNRQFVIYKFRTMYCDQEDVSGVVQTTRGDKRVTPVGKFLRRTSLDELPQFLNVLKGDMSVVGPRPHVPDMLAAGVLYEELCPDYFQRHEVRPGITGLAQVKGWRGMTTDAHHAEMRVKHDLQYIQDFTIWLDIRIIAGTFISEFLMGNAD